MGHPGFAEAMMLPDSLSLSHPIMVWGYHLMLLICILFVSPSTNTGPGLLALLLLLLFLTGSVDRMGKHFYSLSPIFLPPSTKFFFL